MQTISYSNLEITRKTLMKGILVSWTLSSQLFSLSLRKKMNGIPVAINSVAKKLCKLPLFFRLI